MLEKVKQAFLYVLTPIAFVLGFIAYLMTKNKNLMGELATAKAEKQLGATLTKIEEKKEEAQNAEDTFNRLASDYDKQHPGKS